MEAEDILEEETEDTLEGDTLEASAEVVPWILRYYWLLLEAWMGDCRAIL